jgi:hypothetical protein
MHGPKNAGTIMGTYIVKSITIVIMRIRILFLRTLVAKETIMILVS